MNKKALLESQLGKIVFILITLIVIILIIYLFQGKIFDLSGILERIFKFGA